MSALRFRGKRFLSNTPLRSARRDAGRGNRDGRAPQTATSFHSLASRFKNVFYKAPKKPVSLSQIGRAEQIRGIMSSGRRQKFGPPHVGGYVFSDLESFRKTSHASRSGEECVRRDAEHCTPEACAPQTAIVVPFRSEKCRLRLLKTHVFSYIALQRIIGWLWLLGIYATDTMCRQGCDPT